MKETTEGHLKIIIFTVAATAFVTTFTGSALNLSIPDISIQFGASAETAGWIVTGYSLTVAAFSVPFGRIADITSRKTVLAAGIAIFAACCIAAVFSVSVIMLIISRIIQGIGAAMIFSTNTAVLIDAFPGKKRGQVLGYSMAATYAGMSAGPVAGGFLNHHFGWQSIFVMTALIAAAALIAAVFRMPADKNVHRRNNGDIAGSVLYVLFTTMIMYGFSEIGRGVSSYLFISAGMIAGVLFIRNELQAEMPVIKIKQITGNIGYAFANAAAMMNYGATFGVSYLMSVYLQAVLGYSSQTAGIIMISQPAVITLLSPIVGRLSDRLSSYILASVGMIVCAAGICISIFFINRSGLIVALGVMIITGIGISVFSSPNTKTAMSYVSSEEYGSASSLLATMRAMGNTFSMAIVTIVVRRCAGEVSLAASEQDTLMEVISSSFIVFAIICAAGAVISLKR